MRQAKGFERKANSRQRIGGRGCSSFATAKCEMPFIAANQVLLRQRQSGICLSAASYAARGEVRNSLARRRLTAIPCFAYRFSIFGKSTPASAHSRSNHKKVVLILLTALKKDRNKSYPFLMGRSGLEPPTSPLSGVRSNHLS